MEFEKVYLDNLKTLMKERNLKQLDIANIIGVDPSRISKILSGDGFFTFEQAMKIATQLNMPFCSLNKISFNSLPEMLLALLDMIDKGCLDLTPINSGQIIVNRVMLQNALRQIHSLKTSPLHRDLKNRLMPLLINDISERIKDEPVDTDTFPAKKI